MTSFSHITSQFPVVPSAEPLPDKAQQQDCAAKNSAPSPDLVRTETEPQPSLKLVWKVEEGQLVRHWVEA